MSIADQITQVDPDVIESQLFDDDEDVDVRDEQSVREKLGIEELMPGMSVQEYLGLRYTAGQFILADRTETTFGNRVKIFRDRYNWPEASLAPFVDARDQFGSAKSALHDQCAGYLDGTPLESWIEQSPGLGKPSLSVVTGMMPYPTTFDTVSSVWRYLGLDTVDDDDGGRRARRMSDGGHDPELKSFALYRVGGPLIRQVNNNYYREVYDRRKRYTHDTHPPMLDEGEGCDMCDHAYAERRRQGKPGLDCENVGGFHWKPAHRDNDARRIMVKEVMKDWFRAARGQVPHSVY